MTETREEGGPPGVGPVAALAAMLALLPVAAGGQQLWSVGEVSRAPEGPAVMIEGSRGGPGGGVPGVPGVAQPAMSAEIEVTYDYLRLGMGYLELPLPDGSMLEAKNAVFEDRGGGNLMWTGEVPGAGYESVLFTVQDGHLVGWFGEPGGPKYIVYAGPDGRGSLAEEVGPTGDWCGVEAGPGRDLVPVAAAGSRSASVASQSSDSRLDILVLYTTGTERFWRVIGGPSVGIRQLGDYLNMVFRNGAIPATANLIPVRWDPVLRNHPSTQGGHFVTRPGYNGWHDEFGSSAEVGRLVDRHAPDLVHFIPAVGEAARGAAGSGSLRTTLGSRSLYTGWSTPSGGVFAHEIGHNLGGGHDPPSSSLANKSDYIRPYAFGHTDLSSCAQREGSGNSLFCPATIMSYGTEAYTDGNPNTFAVGEPFYSSVRIKPNGWTMGVVGERENERVLREVVPFVMRVNGGGSRVARGKVAAEWTGVDTVRVTWADGTVYWGGVDFSEAGGWSDSDVVSEPWLTPVTGGGVDARGLRPGGEYRVAIGHNRRSIRAFRGGPVFVLEPPKPAAGAPAAPSNVGGRDNGPGAVRLSWRDNSTVETGYEVWYRKWSGDEPDEVWSRYGQRLPAGTRQLDVSGLAAEEEIRVTDGYYDAEERVWVQSQNAKIGRYSFVVVAYNDKGWNASETFHLEFMPAVHRAPTVSGELTDCRSRSTGVDLDGYQVSVCLETPDGARRRAWDYRLDADQSGLLYFFDRDNAEILVKVLDGCAINGQRWVFVAPVTTLPFRLQIRELGPYIANRRRVWYYDSERRPQDRIRRNLGGRVGNPNGRTARTVSDTTAFACTTAEIAAAKAVPAGSGSELGFGAAGGVPSAASPRRLSAGSRTDCDPGGPTLELRGGYRVSMCFETYNGEVGSARDWGLDSSQSGLMYFFERNNAEILIKVLDGCGVNGHRWVFVAPVTDLAFNLVVTSPEGEVWTHSNRLGRTADAASDVSAFPCASSA